MKTNLLLLFFLNSLLGFSQTPINSFYTDDYGFAIVDSSSPLVQGTAGANVVWNFSTFTFAGNSIYTNLTPTSTEIASYPNTTNVTNIASTVSGTTTVSKLYTSKASNVVSLTGLINPAFSLNYNTNNATLGAFPMNYGFTNNDTTAGNFIYGTYNGTFTGTIATSVDAYGTMTLNATTGSGAYSNVPVTRLKTVQNINLIYGLFGNIGTVVITTYSYYRATGNILIFRDATTVVNVPLLSINNQTTSQYEIFNAILLSNTTANIQENKFSIVPNPIQNVLHFENAIDIQKVHISDLNGRMVLNQTPFENDFDISYLQSGVYIVTIVTEYGVENKKIIKL